MFKVISDKTFSVLMGGLLLFGTHAVVGAEQVLIESGGVKLTSQEVNAELQHLPQGARNGLLFRKENVMNLISNLFARRVLAQQMKSEEVAQNAVIKSQLQLAQEKAASDIYLKLLDDRNTPPVAELDKRAREIYKVEINRFAEQPSAKASHILLKPGKNARDLAENLLEKLRKGAEFEALAKEYSEDPGSAQKGGDLGVFQRGRMVKPFDDAVFSADEGALLEPIETQFGLHIIKVMTKTPARHKPYEEVRDELYREIVSKAQTDGRRLILDQILARAKMNATVIDGYIEEQRSKN